MWLLKLWLSKGLKIKWRCLWRWHLCALKQTYAATTIAITFSSMKHYWARLRRIYGVHDIICVPRTRWQDRSLYSFCFFTIKIVHSYSYTHSISILLFFSHASYALLITLLAHNYSILASKSEDRFWHLQLDKLLLKKYF